MATLPPSRAQTPARTPQRVHTWEGTCWGAVIANCSTVLRNFVDIDIKTLFQYRGTDIEVFRLYQQFRPRENSVRVNNLDCVKIYY